MVYVFSFVIYGNEKKYTQGLLINIQLIQNKYPDWKVWIYYGSDVNESMLLEYKSYNNTLLIPTNNTGYISKFYRYFPIDDSSVDICIVRDADSRVSDRDATCINEFLISPCLFHIIRDHPNHNHRIMAGMWGIKKGALNKPIIELFDDWKQNNTFDFWSDTRFLVDCIYPKVFKNSLIHDDINRYNEYCKSIPHCRDDMHFIGQVYEFSNTGIEYPKFKYQI